MSLEGERKYIQYQYLINRKRVQLAERELVRAKEERADKLELTRLKQRATREVRRIDDRLREDAS